MRRLHLAAALALGVTALTPVATAATIPHTAPDTPAAATDPIQRKLDRLVEKTGFPGAIATVRNAKGMTRTYTAGTSDLSTGAPVDPDSRVRVASNTKMFTATVVLQLVAEGKVQLGDPVEEYLPGIVRGNGNDGRDITVRDLLRQTSGLPDYDSIVLDIGDLRSAANTYFEPRQMVDAALAEPRSFEPGTSWEYSNTNYVLLGLLAQRVTGRPIGEEMTRRIIEPLGLSDTYWPGTGEQEIRGVHPRGYLPDGPDGAWRDLTELDPALGWAAGQLVSSPGDVGRFMQALLGGELLPPAQLAQMKETVPAPEFEPGSEWGYGLGIASHPLDCGPLAWGHGGDIQGFQTRNLATEDGRWAVVTVTGLPSTLEMLGDVNSTVADMVCAA